MCACAQPAHEGPDHTQIHTPSVRIDLNPCPYWAAQEKRVSTCIAVLFVLSISPLGYWSSSLTWLYNFDESSYTIISLMKTKVFLRSRFLTGFAGWLVHWQSLTQPLCAMMSPQSEREPATIVQKGYAAHIVPARWQFRSWLTSKPPDAGWSSSCNRSLQVWYHLE